MPPVPRSRIGLNLEVPEKNMKREVHDAKGCGSCHGTTERTRANRPRHLRVLHRKGGLQGSQEVVVWPLGGNDALDFVRWLVDWLPASTPLPPSGTSGPHLPLPPPLASLAPSRSASCDVARGSRGSTHTIGIERDEGGVFPPRVRCRPSNDTCHLAGEMRTSGSNRLVRFFWPAACRHMRSTHNAILQDCPESFGQRR
jgi:hypothetical protein